MRDLLDVHTHTIASVHAYSTLRENITAAKNKGLAIVGIADHGPSMPGAFQDFYFCNFKVIRAHEADYGIKVLMGAELNIIDYSGSTDLRGEFVERLDFAVASLHDPCIRPGTLEQNTTALIGAMRNPKVKIIGHPENPKFPVDFDRLARAAKEHHVLLEVNNSSYMPEGSRAGSREKAHEYLAVCKKHAVPLIMSSDAHLDLDVGNHQYAAEMLTREGYPEELIVNGDPEKFLRFIFRGNYTG